MERTLYFYTGLEQVKSTSWQIQTKMADVSCLFQLNIGDIINILLRSFVDAHAFAWSFLAFSSLFQFTEKYVSIITYSIQ